MSYFKRVYTHAISWQSTGRSSLVTVTGCEGTAWKCVRVGDRKRFFTIVQNRLPRAVGHSPELVLELKEHFDAALSSLSGPYSVRKGYLCCPTAHLSLLCTMLSKGWAPAYTNVSKTERQLLVLLFLLSLWFWIVFLRWFIVQSCKKVLKEQLEWAFMLTVRISSMHTKVLCCARGTAAFEASLTLEGRRVPEAIDWTLPLVPAQLSGRLSPALTLRTHLQAAGSLGRSIELLPLSQ